MQFVGLAAGVIAGTFAAQWIGLDATRVYLATIFLLLPALAGARMLYVVSHWQAFRDNRSEIWNTKSGGATLYGGILAAVPISIPVLSLLQVPFGAFWDIAGIVIMVGMAFTRIGCLMHGCCAGRECTSRFGLYLPDIHGVWKNRYPTQILEVAWAVILLATGLTVWPLLSFDGALFIWIASGYALGRIVMESMRDIGRVRWTLQHTISLVIVALSAAAFVVRKY
jgi:phosphatidylglycerol:prolipoprotein diacylglycerol transferase